MTATLTPVVSPELGSGPVAVRSLPPLSDEFGRPHPRIELCPAGGAPVVLGGEVGVALEMSGVPLEVSMWKDPGLLAQLALRGLARVGRPRLRDLDVLTRAAALREVETGDGGEYRRLTHGRDPGLANMLKCELFRHAEQTSVAAAFDVRGPVTDHAIEGC